MFEKYKSGENHNIQLAEKYSLTSKLPHRYLAYRDFPNLISNYKNIDRALDYGSGVGASTQFLSENGYDVVGTDKSFAMLKKARSFYPHTKFVEIAELENEHPFDIVFSSFVLFELSSKKKILDYLNQSSEALRKGGIFYGITGSEELHKKNRTWLSFNVNYENNISPKSGDIVKLGLKDLELEFEDYYWTEKDFVECFKKSNLELVKIYYPLAHENEPYEWKNEITSPPFVIFIAVKK